MCCGVLNGAHSSIEILLLCRLGLSSSLWTVTRMPTSGCGALRQSLCPRTPTVSCSFSLSDWWSWTTSSGTPVMRPTTRLPRCFLDVYMLFGLNFCVFLFSLLTDRGNDNWLIKYDCPMDTSGNRVCLRLWHFANAFVQSDLQIIMKTPQSCILT